MITRRSPTMRLPQPRLRSNVAGLGGVRCLQPLLGNRDYHNGDPLYAQFRSHPCSCWNSPENILHSGCLRDVRSPPLLLSKMLLWPRDAPGTTPTAPALPKAGRRRQHSDIFVRPYAHTRIQLASMDEKPLVGRSTPECRPVAVFSASSFLAFCSSCRDTVKSHDHTAKSYDSHRLPQPRLRSNVAGLGGVRCLQPLLGNRDYHNGDPLYAQFRSHPCSCWNSPENILHSGCLRDVRSPPLLLSKMLLWPRDAPGTNPTARHCLKQNAVPLSTFVCDARTLKSPLSRMSFRLNRRGECSQVADFSASSPFAVRSSCR